MTPDRYVVDKAAQRIDRARSGAQGARSIPSLRRGTQTRSCPTEANARALRRRGAALAELGVGSRRHYGAPQDTEWAFDPEGERLDAAVAAGNDAPASEDTVGTGQRTGDGALHGLGAAPGVAAARVG